MTTRRPARGAVFSVCRTWRYLLWRRFSAGPVVAFIGLNPSTADERQDDPTVRRCVGFARVWGFGEMRLLNLFAGRATRPNDLLALPDPRGPDWALHMTNGLRRVRCIVCCWGNEGHAYASMLLQPGHLRGRQLWCLGVNANGSPRHPLYVPKSAPLVSFTGPFEEG